MTVKNKLRIGEMGIKLYFFNVKYVVGRFLTRGCKVLLLSFLPLHIQYRNLKKHNANEVNLFDSRLSRAFLKLKHGLRLLMGGSSLIWTNLSTRFLERQE